MKLVVNGFRVTGNTIFTEDVLLAEVKEFVGKEQTIDGLNDAATKVRAYYRERGYFLVQAYLPQQEIKGGVVRRNYMPSVKAGVIGPLGIPVVDIAAAPESRNGHATALLLCVCWRRPNIDHPCRLNIDQGWKAVRCTVGC